MDKEEDFEVDFTRQMRNDMRWFGIKFFGGMILGCAAVVTGVHFLAKYIEEHKPVPTVYCNKQTYNGHDYLFLCTGDPGEKGVVHDPDCACHKSAEKRQAKPQKTEGERFLIMPTVKETSNGTVTSIAK